MLKIFGWGDTKTSRGADNSTDIPKEVTTTTLRDIFQKALQEQQTNLRGLQNRMRSKSGRKEALKRIERELERTKRELETLQEETNTKYNTQKLIIEKEKKRKTAV